MSSWDRILALPCESTDCFGDTTDARHAKWANQFATLVGTGACKCGEISVFRRFGVQEWLRPALPLLRAQEPALLPRPDPGERTKGADDEQELHHQDGDPGESDQLLSYQVPGISLSYSGAEVAVSQVMTAL